MNKEKLFTGGTLKRGLQGALMFHLGKTWRSL